MNSQIVIAGGGVGALETALGLAQAKGLEAEVLLVAPSMEFVYTPLSVLEPFGLGTAPRFDVREVVGDEVEVVQAAIMSVVPSGNRVRFSDGRSIRYDALVVAVGAEAGDALEGAIEIGTPDAIAQLHEMIEQMEADAVRNIAFVVPPGVSWTLPLYELALMTKARARERGLADVHVRVVTPEMSPIAILGVEASERVSAILKQSDVELITSAYAKTCSNDCLHTMAHGPIDADCVVALPRLRGRRIAGLPHDNDGFLRTDDNCLVAGTDNVYAVGDVTSFPVKQGGIACQQADVVVSVLASMFGADGEPHTFKPILHSILLVGEGHLSAHSKIAGGAGYATGVSYKPAVPAWKIQGEYLPARLGQLAAFAATEHEELAGA